MSDILEAVLVFTLQGNDSSLNKTVELEYVKEAVLNINSEASTIHDTLRCSIKIGDIGSFCFPNHASITPSVHRKSMHYCFALTVEGGSRVFGFCKRFQPSGYGERLCIGDRLPKVICLVTKHEYHDLFPSVLDILHTRYVLDPSSISNFVDEFAKSNPSPGLEFRVKSPSCGILCQYKFKCPRTTDTGYAIDLFRFFTPKILQYIIGAVLCERRVIFVGSSEDNISACVFGILACIKPFEWQHIFIPALPNHLLEYAAAPAPYLIGILDSQLDEVKKQPLGDVVIVKLHKNELSTAPGGDAVTPYGYPLSPPEDAVMEEEKASSVFTSDIASVYNKYRRSKRFDQYHLEVTLATHLYSFAIFIFGDLLKFFKRELGSIANGVERFIESVHDPDMRNFLLLFKHSQIFECFIQDRLQSFKSGPNPFEKAHTKKSSFYDQLNSCVRPHSLYAEVKRVVQPNIKIRTCIPLPQSKKQLLDYTSGNSVVDNRSSEDLSRRSYDLSQGTGFLEGMQQRLYDNSARHWRNILKTLQYMQFLLSSGNELIVSFCIDHMEQIYKLIHFSNTAIGVSANSLVTLRQTARETFILVNDIKQIRALRSPGGHKILQRQQKLRINEKMMRLGEVLRKSGKKVNNFEQLNVSLEPWLNFAGPAMTPRPRRPPPPPKRIQVEDLLHTDNGPKPPPIPARPQAHLIAASTTTPTNSTSVPSAFGSPPIPPRNSPAHSSGEILIPNAISSQGHSSVSPNANHPNDQAILSPSIPQQNMFVSGINENTISSPTMPQQNQFAGSPIQKVNSPSMPQQNTLYTSGGGIHGSAILSPTIPQQNQFASNPTQTVNLSGMSQQSTWNTSGGTHGNAILSPTIPPQNQFAVAYNHGQPQNAPLNNGKPFHAQAPPPRIQSDNTIQTGNAMNGILQPTQIAITKQHPPHPPAPTLNNVPHKAANLNHPPAPSLPDSNSKIDGQVAHSGNIKFDPFA